MQTQMTSNKNSVLTELNLLLQSSYKCLKAVLSIILKPKKTQKGINDYSQRLDNDGPAKLYRDESGACEVSALASGYF